MKEAKMEPVVEEIEEDSRLLWIGHRQGNRVLLYFHGTFREASSLHPPLSHPGTRNRWGVPVWCIGFLLLFLEFNPKEA